MVEAMKKYLYSMLSKVDGIYAIVITDRDGVPVMKVSTENCPEPATRPSYLTTFGMATDQAGKMGLGRNQRIICMYSSYQVVHFNKLPLLVTVIGSADANTGLLLGLESDLEEVIQDLKTAVTEA